MALSTILGLVLSFSFMIWSIATQGGIARVMSFIDFGSLVLVLGCSAASVITNYTFQEIWSSLKGIKYAFAPLPVKPDEIIDLLVKMAAKARREGLIALREDAPKYKFPLLTLGVGLLADGTDLEVTREILDTASTTEANKLAADERLWRDISIYGPTFGMLGTIIGLVLMLRSLTDPASIGPAMALALITTFYGIIISGTVCLPIAGKIRAYNERLSLIRTLIVEGLISIQAGDNSQIVKERLRAYVTR